MRSRVTTYLKALKKADLRSSTRELIQDLGQIVLPDCKIVFQAPPVNPQDQVDVDMGSDDAEVTLSLRDLSVAIAAQRDKNT